MHLTRMLIRFPPHPTTPHPHNIPKVSHILSRHCTNQHLYIFKQAAIFLLAKPSVRHSTMAGPLTPTNMTEKQDLKTKQLTLTNLYAYD